MEVPLWLKTLLRGYWQERQAATPAKKTGTPCYPQENFPPHNQSAAQERTAMQGTALAPKLYKSRA